MAWRKKNGQTEPEPEPESRSDKMGEKSPDFDVAVEAAERFLQQVRAVKALLTDEDINYTKKSPEMRRLKRASLDLSSELVIIRKALT